MLCLSRLPFNTVAQTRSLATGGIYAALGNGNNMCFDGDSLDGTVVEMTIYNETLLGIGDQCGTGKLNPFRNLVIMSNHTMAMMEESLSGSNKSIGLFGLLVPEGRLVRIVKISSNPIVAVMPYMSTEFDLQGMELVTYNLPWKPFIDIGCNANGCQVWGYYPKLLSLLQKRFNFTVVYKLEPSGSWGSPSEFGSNSSSILKRLHSGKSAFTFPWVCTHERAMQFDCVSGYRVKLNMYMMETGSKVTMDMVFKPFTNEAWAAMIMFFCTVILLYQFLARSNCSVITRSVRVKTATTFFAWLTATLLIAFYRGSLIIALTSKMETPFEDILQGLAKPEWHLVYEKSYAGVIKSYLALLPSNVNKAKALLSPSYEYASDDLSKNFKQLRDRNTFLVIEGARGVYHLRQADCQPCKNAFRFGRSDTRNSGLLLEKNSPLGEVLRIGVAQMRESGFLDSIMHSYMGPTYRAIPDHSAAPLTLHLTILLFVFLGSVALVLSPIILSFEYLWMKSTHCHTPPPGQCKMTLIEGKCPNCGCRQIYQKVCVK